jgi:hypothetical protein
MLGSSDSLLSSGGARREPDLLQQLVEKSCRFTLPAGRRLRTIDCSLKALGIGAANLFGEIN